MHNLLSLPRPKMPHLAYGLTESQLRAAAKNHVSKEVAGLTVSTIGGAFGPTWPVDGEHTLDFLKHFAGLKHLRIVLPNLTSLEPLRFVQDTLETLIIDGFEKPPKFSLGPIAHCRRLRWVGLVRAGKDLEVVWSLPELEELSLTGFRTSDLTPAKPLKKLRMFYVGFGGLENVEVLQMMPKLVAFQAMRTKGLSDLTPVATLTDLQYLALGDLAQVERFPDCSKLRKLRRAFLDTMNGIKDLTGLAKAPALEELIVINSKITADVFKPLVKHPKLKRATIGLASRKEEKAADAAFGARAVSVFGTEFEQFTLR
jgi:hypothetical protein